MLIFELIELVSGEGTSREAFTEWLSRPEGFNQITSTTVKEVGCSPVNHNCNVRAVSSTFIRGSDLRMSYRAIDWLCACMIVSPPLLFRR